MNIRVIKAALISITALIIFQKQLNENKIYTISSEGDYDSRGEYLPLDKPISEYQYNMVLKGVGLLHITDSVIQNTTISFEILNLKKFNTWFNILMLAAIISLILSFSDSRPTGNFN